MLLNNQQITGEIKKEIKVCTETNENENTTTQNLWDTIKAVLRGNESESEAAQLCLTLSDPMDCSLPGSSIHGSFQARVLEWGAIAFSTCHCQALLILSALNKITHSTFLSQVLLSLILQMKSLQYRVVKKLVKGQTTSECWSQD